MPCSRPTSSFYHLSTRWFWPLLALLLLVTSGAAAADRLTELASKLKTDKDFRVRTQAALALGFGSGLSPFAAGWIALVLIVVGAYLGFTKDIPFTRPYQVKAVFTSSNGLRADSPVRIAGVEVGKVAKIEPAEEGINHSVVTMSITEPGCLVAGVPARIIRRDVTWR